MVGVSQSFPRGSDDYEQLWSIFGCTNTFERLLYVAGNEGEAKLVKALGLAHEAIYDRAVEQCPERAAKFFPDGPRQYVSGNKEMRRMQTGFESNNRTHHYWTRELEWEIMPALKNLKAVWNAAYHPQKRRQANNMIRYSRLGSG